MKHIDAAQKARIIASVRAAAVATATLWNELDLVEDAMDGMWDELGFGRYNDAKVRNMVDEIAKELDIPPDGSKISDAEIWEWIEGCRQTKAAGK